MTRIKAERYHDISCGHRVVGHEGKCRFLHGHNYRVHFTCETQQLDDIGRVIDFGVIKEKLCMWLEDNWDHKFIAWDEDALIQEIESRLGSQCETDNTKVLDASLVYVPFNPTAENMGQYLLETIGPQQLKGTGVELTKVTIDETRKCSATVEI